MTILPTNRLALAIALALFAPSLWAGEVVLFEGENFQGGSMAVRDVAPNLDPTGFNDRTASISVRDGTWEVCSDADFQGACMQLQPGDYPRLDPPFDRSISSLREVGGAASSGVYTAPAPQLSLGVSVPGVSIGINLPSYPALVPVPGYPVYYAPQLDSNYFFYDGMYWVYQQDNWYASSWYNGPWSLIDPNAVPLYVLRVPVGYYRRPPDYFRGWSSNAPPRWDQHWGNKWAQSHRGWNNWNRNADPAPAPLPAHQGQYAGNGYPAVPQQRALQNQNYRYQPQDPAVRQHYQTQQSVAPAPRGQQQVYAPAARGQQQQSAAPPAARSQQQQSAAPPAPRGPQQQSGSAATQRRAPAPSPQAGPPAGQQRQQQAPAQESTRSRPNLGDKGEQPGGERGR